MPILLTVTAGPHAGRTFRFERHETFLVGRAPEAHFSLPDDPYFSRMHFLVEANPPLCRLTDLSSRNGTVVNGKKVQSAELNHGDEIKGGRTVLKVAIIAETPGQTLDLPAAEGALPSLAKEAGQVADVVNDYRQRCQPGEQPGPGESARRSPPLAQAIERSLDEETSGVNDNFSTVPPYQAPTFPYIAGYELTAELGKGGMGVVYQARRQCDKAEVAIKTIRPASLVSPQATARFLREAGILQQLQHPNIVAFHESGQANGLLFFVMEFVPGTDADKLVRRHGPMEIRRAVGLTRGMLAGVEYAHSRRFIHRDIKPANLLVQSTSQGEQAKLADFGLARTYQESPLSGLTLSGVGAGTPQFMPPEQITDFRSVQPAADQYSAAATLYFLLTGRYTYDADSMAEIFRKKLTEEPVPLLQRRTDVPPALAATVHKALARRPEDRYADVAAFARELQPFA
jgi:serine/threonine-protein kinase